MPEGAQSAEESERWLVIKGRRWRRTDPALPEELVAALKSHLGRGRSGVGAGKKTGDDERVAASRRRVGLAKTGLGERGPYWWERPEAQRIAAAKQSLAELESLDDPDESASQ
ncbi:biopolymer transporter Tol [Nesterenkonia sp. LB17]|uniref:biopolymer transporter Tol n=1 Tax=unclassified Nesterenkonia TaxID=2629769 RepID=UPI001F4C6F6E|nr:MULTISPECIES: biopolymer transporter Tol [unclassified Nesterenkonia]MCH8559147.1 biopolymer transporter Tol [Nesterenkonia sp. DZ6]MCH8563061.1 biopolymer transporter Tol [Nesterenkonia sp. YGD6]MCH8565123.1 biopolymer transporter Tol [Nesterenkonia sp. LB17]MCH8571481.1 biopolymer transporter Tol [Nesterenkonia sp. AY15]